jgi:transposase
MELLGRVLSRLMEASGSARRALARAMRAEGTSIPAIARLFGVTHQRISNILNSPSAAPSPLHEAPSPTPGEAGQFDQVPERLEAGGR